MNVRTSQVLPWLRGASSTTRCSVERCRAHSSWCGATSSGRPAGSTSRLMKYTNEAYVSWSTANRTGTARGAPGTPGPLTSATPAPRTPPAAASRTPPPARGEPALEEVGRPPRVAEGRLHERPDDPELELILDALHVGAERDMLERAPPHDPVERPLRPARVRRGRLAFGTELQRLEEALARLQGELLRPRHLATPVVAAGPGTAGAGLSHRPAVAG